MIMKSYEIKKLHNSDFYPYVIYSTSYINPLEEIEGIQDELNNQFEGTVLFDLLLSNGVSSNRFVEAEFDGQSFIYNSFRIPSTIDDFIKEISVEFYKKHPEYLKSSILPKTQRFLVRKGKLI